MRSAAALGERERAAERTAAVLGLHPPPTHRERVKRGPPLK